jgi:PmbA protein
MAAQSVPVVGLEDDLVGATRLFDVLEAVLAAAHPDPAEAVLLVERERYSRLARERLHQTLDRVTVTVTCRVLVDDRIGRASLTATHFDPTELVSAARRAAQGAPVPAGFHFAGPGAETVPASFPYYDAGTAAVGPLERAEWLSRAAAVAREAGAALFGSCHTTLYELAVATSAGCRAYVPLTEAGANLVATLAGRSGLGFRLGRAWSRLDPFDVASEAVSRVVPGLRFQDGEWGKLPARRLPVVLAGYAVADALTFLNQVGFDRRSQASGIGPWGGTVRLSPLVTVADDARRTDGLPIPFDQEGVPKQRVTLIDRGRPVSVVSDLRTAAEYNVASTGHAHRSRLPFADPVAANLRMMPGIATERDLIARVDAGVYVTSFHYTRLVDVKEAVITGMTRHGTYAIEHGRLTRPLRDLRFTESLWRLFGQVAAVGDTLFAQPMLNVLNSVAEAPAVLVDGFTFDWPPLGEEDHT